MDQTPWRILVNTQPLIGEETGVGNYARHITLALTARSDLFRTTFYHCYYSQSLPNAKSRMQRLLTWTKNKVKASPVLRSLGKKTLACLRTTHNALHKTVFDCYFEPNFILLPQIEARKNLLTVHDFSCLLYPEWHPKERVRYLEEHFPKSLERADHLIMVSETMRQEAVTRFGLALEKISVIPNGLDHQVFHPMDSESSERLLAPYKLPNAFILFAGTFEPRKNLSHLLAAYALLPKTLKNRFPLLLCGAEGWKNNDILEEIRRQAPFVRSLGYVPEAILCALYNRAAVMCYPSWYEGFGLPVVEAMACGCPVLASNNAALTETAGGCAKLADPADIQGISNALREVLEDEDWRKEHKALGLAHAAKYSWEQSAQAHISLISKLCAG
ncbi:MAG: glycosyltransferase family 4 protein [Desulfovibrio sp.]|nr:glycosyltransferase family 4 protein [Desulfovibrio sp.]